MQTETVLDRMDRLAGQLAIEDSRLRLLGQRLRSSEMELDSIRGRIAKLTQEQERRRRLLRQRLRGLYMGGPASTVRLIVMSQSLWELLDRWSLVTLLSRHDLRLIESYRRSEWQLRGLEAVAEREVKQRAELLDRQSRGKRRLARLYSQRASQLAALEKNKEQKERLLEQMERERDRLRDAIAAKELKRAGRLNPDAAVLENMRGRLPWPVRGRRAPKPAVGGRGVQILAPEGSPVHPVAAGEVVYADWVRGYGLLLVIRHGGEMYTVYAGADDLLVAKGDRVDRRQIIAHVGKTAALGQPSLYFEIRKGSIPLDPLSWLSPRH